MFAKSCFIYFQIFVALPQPSQMITKVGMNIENVEMLQSLVKMVIPVSISRSVLSRGVQVRIKADVSF